MALMFTSPLWAVARLPPRFTRQRLCSRSLEEFETPLTTNGLILETLVMMPYGRPPHVLVSFMLNLRR